jgi:hypothetical protein
MFLSAHSWASRVQTRSIGMFQGIPKRNLPFELSFIKELTLQRKADRVRSFLSLSPLGSLENSLLDLIGHLH